MTNTDSVPFQDDRRRRSACARTSAATQIGSGWDPHWHQPTDVFATFSDKDFRLGLNAAQTTLAAIAQLAGAKTREVSAGEREGRNRRKEERRTRVDYVSGFSTAHDVKPQADAHRSVRSSRRCTPLLCALGVGGSVLPFFPSPVSLSLAVHRLKLPAANQDQQRTVSRAPAPDHRIVTTRITIDP